MRNKQNKTPADQLFFSRTWNVAGWEGKDQNLLKASLATIRETAESLITDIDAKFQELAKGLEQAAPEVEPGTYSRSFTSTGLNRWNV